MNFYEENPGGVTKADVIVAVPSLNEAASIGHTTTQADLGLTRHFPRTKAVIINCDNSSADGTKEAFFATETRTPKMYLATPPGVTGKGQNLKNLFVKAGNLGARACVTVDADLRSISPQWIKHFVEPLLDGFDYVAPLYVRHKYDGAITSSIVYPLTRALYGRRVRQPVGGDFGFSGPMAGVFLKSPDWNDVVGQFGIDIWMTTQAVNSRLPICQAFMGRPKIHRGVHSTKDPGLIFRQVVGTLFFLAGTMAEYWKRVRWSKPTALFGTGPDEPEPAPPVSLDEADLYRRFCQGFDKRSQTWSRILSPDVAARVAEVRSLPQGRFELPTQCWTRVLFDFARAYHHVDIDRDLLLDALMPLYYGKLLSLVKKTEQMNPAQAEEVVEQECTVFEETKPYFLTRWNEKY